MPATSGRLVLIENAVAHEKERVTRAVAGDARVPPPPPPRQQHEKPAQKTSRWTSTKSTRRTDQRDKAIREEGTGTKKYFPELGGYRDIKEHQDYFDHSTGLYTHEAKGAKGPSHELHARYDVLYAKVAHNCDRSNLTSDLRSHGASILIIYFEEPLAAKDFVAEWEKDAAEDAAKEAEKSKEKEGSSRHGRGEDTNPDLQWHYQVKANDNFVLAGRKGIVTAILQSEPMMTTDTDHDIVVFEVRLDVAVCNTEKVMVAVAGDSINAAATGNNKITWLQAMEKLWKLEVRILGVQFKPNFVQLVEDTRRAGYEFRTIAMDFVSVGKHQGVTSSFILGMGPITTVKMPETYRRVYWEEVGEWMTFKDITDWPGEHRLCGRYPFREHSWYYWTKDWPVYEVAYQEAITNRQIAHPPPQPR